MHVDAPDRFCLFFAVGKSVGTPCMRSHIVVHGATTKSCDNPFVFKNEIERKDFQEIARLAWAHETRLQQFHPFFITTNDSNKSGNLLFAQSEPNGIKTLNSDTVLVQEARLRRADASEAGALPGAIWHSGTAVYESERGNDGEHANI